MTDWKTAAIEAHKQHQAEIAATEADHAERARMDLCARFKKFMANLGIECDPASNRCTVDSVEFQYTGTVNYKSQEHVSLVGKCKHCHKDGGLFGEIVDLPTLGAAMKNGIAENAWTTRLVYEHPWDCTPQSAINIPQSETPAACPESIGERLAALIREIVRNEE